MSKIKNVMLFKNGNIAVFDEGGEQVPKLQGGWIDFEALRELAKVIAKDNPKIEGILPTAFLGYDPLDDYVNHYKTTAPTKAKGE